MRSASASRPSLDRRGRWRAAAICALDLAKADALKTNRLLIKGRRSPKPPGIRAWRDVNFGVKSGISTPC